MWTFFQSLLDWLKTSFTPILAVLTASVVLATVPDAALEATGLKDFRDQYRTWIGVALLASLALFLGRSIQLFATWLRTRLTAPITLAILPDQLGTPRWSPGTTAGQPAMHVVAYFTITNLTDDVLELVHTELRRGYWLDAVLPRYAQGHVSVRHWERDIYGDYQIPPHTTTRAMLDYSIQPPIRQAPRHLRATVTLVDNQGNKHTVRNVLFQAPKPPRTEPQPPREKVQQLADAVEKDVASILKSEVNRYRQCGRRVGGLGSVRTQFGPGTRFPGRTLAGMGTETRDADSPENQSIVLNTDSVTILSDNLDALLAVHRRLCSDEERERFVQALLRRLSRDTEYFSVGYLIILTLFSIDRLPDGLRAARQHLRNDSVHGFGDCLLLLDGLLRFRHSDFSLELLDQIEHFLDGLQHSEEYINTRIEERTHAIRALRLSAPSEPQAAPANS